jgi:hypothetical protein
MIVTESEARRLWCPQMGISHGDGDVRCCMASSCAAWRWHEWRMKRGPDGQFLNPAVQEQTGFCGLAYAVRLP